MPFTPKNWLDEPNTTTPINAAALEDMEQRLSDYTDTAAIPASVYRTLLRCATNISTSAAAATKYAIINGAQIISSPGAATTAQAAPWFLYLDDAEYAVTGKTIKLRVRGMVSVGTVTPAVTYTFGLYPLTVSSSSIALGTVVAGSAATVAPATSEIKHSTDGADFTIPADGIYGLGVTVSGTPGANANVYAALQMRAT
jgi:uncharacterized protein YaiE (UPF0345 family)